MTFLHLPLKILYGSPLNHYRLPHVQGQAGKSQFTDVLVSFTFFVASSLSFRMIVKSLKSQKTMINSGFVNVL